MNPTITQNLIANREAAAAREQTTADLNSAAAARIRASQSPVRDALASRRERAAAGAQARADEHRAAATRLREAAGATWRCRHCDTYNADGSTTCMVCDSAK